jgi:flagellar protein FliO/FliZ
MIAMKSYLFIPLLLLALFTLPLSGFTQENDHIPLENEQESPHFVDHSEVPGARVEHVGRESDNFQTKFFNMLFILGLLIGFMLLASWALRRMMKSRMTQLNTASSIKLLETRYLSPKATLYLVEVQSQVFLLGESPTNLTYLATLPSEEEFITQEEQKP